MFTLCSEWLLLGREHDGGEDKADADDEGKKAKVRGDFLNCSLLAASPTQLALATLCADWSKTQVSVKPVDDTA